MRTYGAWGMGRGAWGVGLEVLVVSQSLMGEGLEPLPGTPVGGRTGLGQYLGLTYRLPPSPASSISHA